VAKKLFTLRCRNCGKKHQIRNKWHYYSCDKCKKNLILYCVPNYLNAEVLYKSKELKTDNLWSERK
jgi:ribosomal protein L37AE/L43A